MWLVIACQLLSEQCNSKTDFSIPECPAFEICKSTGRRCEACLNISVEAWRHNVAAICNRRR